jgi:16S rRNA (guanine1207-N2)-methyltransferase
MTINAPDGEWLLSRHDGNDSLLKAWDAADELLLEVAVQRLAATSDTLQTPRVLVIDDQFGALTLGLNAFDPEVVADSAVLPVALAHNTSINVARSPSLNSQPYSWLRPPERRYDVIIMRIPRHSDYLAWLLRWVNEVLADDGLLLAGGMIKHLPDKSVDVFAGAVKTEEVCPARKKARVVICRRGEASLQNWPGTWKGYVLDNNNLDIKALPAVFAREKLDIGTRLLIPHIAGFVANLAMGARVLDLACGNGVLGIVTLQHRADLAVTFSDVSSQAIASAKHNASRLYPYIKPLFVHADGIAVSNEQYQRILLNPPFHEGGTVGDHIAMKLFAQAAEHLSPTGTLLMVGNRHLGYHRSLRRFFPHVRQLDADSRFVVFEASVTQQA